ncbi:unnamed protein product, partial [marine sediment metagenome]
MAGVVDEFRIDSHKLAYHPERVSQWLNGNSVYPIYAEVALAGGCQHRCIFCAFDYIGYKKVFQSSESLLNALKQAAFGGLKAVMFAGEGEPLLHPGIKNIVWWTYDLGLNIAITTNASLLTPELSRLLLPHLSWLRASINAGTPETYAKVHRVAPSEFEKVISNLAAAAEIDGSCIIGAQIVVLPENRHEVETLAQRLADIGLGYLIVKPYSQHPKSVVRRETEPLPEVRIDGIKVIMRHRAEENLQSDKTYQHCLGLPFWSYIDAQGNVWGCSCFLGDKR